MIFIDYGAICEHCKIKNEFGKYRSIELRFNDRPVPTNVLVCQKCYEKFHHEYDIVVNNFCKQFIGDK